MRTPNIAIMLGMIGLLVISGCLTDRTAEVQSGDSGEAQPESVLSAPELELSIPDMVELKILNVSSDKSTYHSSELMNLSVMIHSGSDIEGVTVTARGVNGRMEIQKMVNLTSGENGVSFSYTLPRCNVCGGIRAGAYELTCEASYGNTSVQDSTSVEILQ